MSYQTENWALDSRVRWRRVDRLPSSALGALEDVRQDLWGTGQAYLPKTGYVGLRQVTGPAVLIDEATIDVDGQPTRLLDLPLRGDYRHDNAEPEWVVPVRWQHPAPRAGGLATGSVHQHQQLQPAAPPLHPRHVHRLLREPPHHR